MFNMFVGAGLRARPHFYIFRGWNMKKAMYRLIIMFAVITITSIILYKYTESVFVYSLVVTFFTFLYHFVMRLIVGFFCDNFVKPNYKSKWFVQRSFEKKLYSFLKVKKWKNKMPTYNADTFDVSKHSWDEIIQATCQAELVHEINVIFSFLPIFASIWFDSFGVFLITSALGAAFDLMFVMMQRFKLIGLIIKLNKLNQSMK